MHRYEVIRFIIEGGRRRIPSAGVGLLLEVRARTKGVVKYASSTMVGHANRYRRSARRQVEILGTVVVSLYGAPFFSVSPNGVVLVTSSDRPRVPSRVGRWGKVGGPVPPSAFPLRGRVTLPCGFDSLRRLSTKVQQRFAYPRPCHAQRGVICQ